MTRLFYAFFFVGMALVVAAAALTPLPHNARYRSATGVVPDGGRTESFVIQWPQDRVQPLRSQGAGPIGVAGAAAVLPGAQGDTASAELFRLRDRSGNVIGLASRSTSTHRSANGAASQSSDWVLMIPARGTLFMTQLNGRDVEPRPAVAGGTPAPAGDGAAFWAGGTRLRVTAGPAVDGSGQVVGGTEEFAALKGTYDETWDLEQVAADGSTRGRITLDTRIATASE